MNEDADKVWQAEAVVESYLRDVSEAIPDRARQIEVMLRLLEGRGTPVERFLDLGCGDGILSGAVLRRYPSACGVLVDYSPPMLEAARRRFAAENADLKIIQGDLGQAATMRGLAAEGPFDAVISGFAIHHLTHGRKREIFSEIFGLLRPGGIFINHEHVASASPWIEQNWDRLMVDRIYAHRRNTDPAVDRATVESEYASREDRAANILASVDLQCAWLREIGFGDVDCFFKLFELATFGGRRL